MCGHDTALHKALSIFWTSGRKTGVIDVSQQIDRMCTTRVECPCLTPQGMHYLMEHGRPMLGATLVEHICTIFCYAIFCWIAWHRYGKVHYPGIPGGENVAAAYGRQGHQFCSLVIMEGSLQYINRFQELADLAGNVGPSVPLHCAHSFPPCAFLLRVCTSALWPRAGQSALLLWTPKNSYRRRLKGPGETRRDEVIRNLHGKSWYKASLDLQFFACLVWQCLAYVHLAMTLWLVAAIKFQRWTCIHETTWNQITNHHAVSSVPGRIQWKHGKSWSCFQFSLNYTEKQLPWNGSKLLPLLAALLGPDRDQGLGHHPRHHLHIQNLSLVILAMGRHHRRRSTWMKISSNPEWQTFWSASWRPFKRKQERNGKSTV